MAVGGLQKDLTVPNDVYRVMAVDALVTSHPLTTPADEVNTPAQISEMFDTISYSKVLPSPHAGPQTVGGWVGGAVMGTQGPPAGSRQPPELPPLHREPRSSGCSRIS